MKFEELPTGSLSINLSEALHTRIGGKLILKLTDKSYIRVLDRTPVVCHSWAKSAKRKIMVL